MKKRFSSIAWMIIFCLLTLSLVPIGEEVSAENEENPKWSKWLQKNAFRIKKLDSTSKDAYEDLGFLKKVLKGKRIVLLGESSHGAAEFNSTKVRLIKYLHEKLGYKVLAFESGLAETNASDAQMTTAAPIKMMQDSLYPVWYTQEVSHLFEYMKKEKKGRTPLSLAGIDMQPTGSYAAFLKNWFQTIDSSIGDKAHLLEQKYLGLLTLSITDTFNREQKKMIQEYKELSQFVQKNKKELAKAYPNSPHMIRVTQYVLQDRIYSMEHGMKFLVWSNKYVKENNAELANKYFDQFSEARDEAMAKHLTWLAEKLYPKQKIIVWAHNLHIRKANTKAENPYRSSVVTFGQLLPKKIKDQSYVIGLYMNRGVSAFNNRQPAPVRFPHPKGTMESILGNSGYKNIFVDMKNQQKKEGTSWMFTKRAALDWGTWEEQIIPTEQYDGILFIDKVQMPKYVNNTISHIPQQELHKRIPQNS
jgi:erythromycin esterase